MKKVIVTSILICSAVILHAQNYNWALHFGNYKSDKATCVKTDDSGYVYVAGYFADSMLIGINNVILKYSYNNHSKEIFVTKLDSNGYCYWAKSGGAFFDDRVLGMDVDAKGNVTIAGTYYEALGGITFGGINLTATTFGGGDQGFIYRLDRLGNVQWGKFICSNGGDDQSLDAATDADGNTYVVGFMAGTTLYCGGNTVTATNTNTDWHKQCYWLTKVDSNGNFKWAKTFGRLPWDTSFGKYIERDIAVCVDKKAGVYITGGFNMAPQFGGITKASTGGYDIFAMKYDTAGNFVWVTTGGSRKDDWSSGICSDKDGHIYITGEFRDSLLFDTILVNNYNARDAFVIKLDANTGKAIWGKHAGTPLGDERGNDVVADANCNVYVCGDIQSGAKFGSLTVPLGKSVEAFVARISTEGKWRWVATGGGLDSNDRGNSIAMGKNGQLYTCGFYRVPATFGSTSLPLEGKTDAFVARLSDTLFNTNEPFNLTPPTKLIFCIGDSTVMQLPKQYKSLSILPANGFVIVADSIIFKPTVTTTYTVIAAGTEKCFSWDTVLFTIQVGQYPIASFVVNPLEAFLNTPQFTLNNTSTNANGATYQWLHNGTNIGSNTDGFYSVPNPDTIQYCFTLIATSPYNCADTATNCGKVILQPLVYIANAFVPGSNIIGNNEFKLIFGNVDVAAITEYKMVIVDRFGNNVFTSTNPQSGWNGKDAQGNIKELGTYFYVIEYVINKKKTKKRGDVLLLK